MRYVAAELAAEVPEEASFSSFSVVEPDSASIAGLWPCSVPDGALVEDHLLEASGVDVGVSPEVGLSVVVGTLDRVLFFCGRRRPCGIGSISLCPTALLNVLVCSEGLVVSACLVGEVDVAVFRETSSGVEDGPLGVPSS